MSAQFRLRFWGVRGSYPVPGPGTIHVGGNTPCVEIEANGHLIILDGGTGLIHLGNDLVRRQRENGGKPIHAVILFSHTHHDHTQGVPYFTPAYIPTSTFYIFGPRMFHEQVNEALRRSMLPPNFPIELDDLRSMRIVRDLHEAESLWLLPEQPEPVIRNIYREGPLDVDDVVRIDVLKSYGHPQEGVYIYKVSYRGHSIVYATDTEGYIGGDRRLIQFSRGADVLIHDAQYTQAEYLDPVVSKQGWGHSTPEMAIEVAQAAQVKQLYLFHHDPSHDDETLFEIEAEAQKLFPNTYLAREGLDITIL